MLTNDFRIARVQKALRWFEDDVALLNMRVKDLSAERQESARRFAAAVITETRAELEKLLHEQPAEAVLASEPRLRRAETPSEPAD